MYSILPPNSDILPSSRDLPSKMTSISIPTTKKGLLRNSAMF